ncbi:MAG: IPExxxVDY family protein [Flavobacteriales bacterium]
MKHLLVEDYDYDFKLYGISCHSKDYRLCWGINNTLGLKLEKGEIEIELITRKSDVKSTHAVFSCFCEELQNQYYLLVNRTPNGLLIPEKPQADYLLMIKESYELNPDEILNKMKSIPFVLTAFSIEVESLKSKKNLIF